MVVVRSPRARRWIVPMIVLLGLAYALAATPAAVAAPGRSCTRVSIPVALGPGSAADQQLAGTLCGVEPGDPNQVVQLLVPGYTYSSIYWDFPYQPERDSYAARANAAGYATLAIDRIGTGASSHPPAVEVSIDANVYTIHQVVQALRSGQLGKTFRTVIQVSHSLGSFLSILEIAAYHDVAGFVQTGYLDSVGPFLPLVAALIPAQLDPVTAAQQPPLGYQTTPYGARQLMFYNPPTTDPAVVKIDEQTKTTAGLELPTAATALTSQLLGNALSALDIRIHNASQQINMPVLVAMGSEDRLFCGLQTSCATPADLRAAVGKNYGPNTNLETYVLPGAGHDSALATNSSQLYDAVIDWTTRHFANG